MNTKVPLRNQRQGSPPKFYGTRDNLRNRELVSRLAQELVTDFHLSVRDAGAILGLSGARVAQMLNEKTVA